MSSPAPITDIANADVSSSLDPSPKNTSAGVSTLPELGTPPTCMMLFLILWVSCAVPAMHFFQAISTGLKSPKEEPTGTDFVTYRKWKSGALRRSKLLKGWHFCHSGFAKSDQTASSLSKRDWASLLALRSRPRYAMADASAETLFRSSRSSSDMRFEGRPDSHAARERSLVIRSILRTKI